MKAEVIHYPNAEQLAREAAKLWLAEISQLDNPKVLCIALSGGRIARTFFKALADQAGNRRKILASTHFFWVDERCVPPDHTESNYLLARNFLLQPLDIAPAQIHRIRGEIEPDIAARQAEAELRRIAPMNQDGFPLLDYAFLGMGEDGHIASLFPELPSELLASSAVYNPVVASKPPPFRITLTYKSLQMAKSVWVLASGEGKSIAMQSSLGQQSKTPLGRLMAMREHTRIFTDI